MTSQQEALSFQRFLQYVEDSGLRAYDDLVIQNASDIARESDRIRNQTNWTYQQEKHQKKRRQEDTIKRIGEDVSKATEGGYAGKHFRIGFMTMPAPQDRVAPPIQGFAVRSQSLHSVGVADDDSNHNRKQPPPKPRRDPNTKLSNSSEMVNGGSNITKNPRDTKESQEQIEAGSHLTSEEYKKMPPPKPRRNPNTQLSSSFDESYIHNYGNRKCSFRWEKSSSHSQSPASQDTDDDEPVYIEMVGNILQELKRQDNEEDDQNESVYEEMKYPVLEEFLQDPGLDSNPAIMVPDSWSSTCRGSSCNIPPPFPNLLAHHPPLLVFPSAPTQCSPNSDESPLTPLEVSRLPMLEHVGASKSGPAEVQQHSQHCKERDRERGREFPSTHTITSSGRSSAPPLSSSSSHMAHGYPRSQSACPSPVSMSHSLTPVNLKRPPPYDTLTAGGSTRRLSSSTQVTQEGLTKLSDLTSSTQNVSKGSQTAPSPREDRTIPNVIKKGSGRQKSRETEGKSKCPSSQDSQNTDGERRWSPGPSRRGRSSVSPTMMLSGGETKSTYKHGRSPSTSGVPSPGGTPQHQIHETHPALSQAKQLYYIHSCGDQVNPVTLSESHDDAFEKFLERQVQPLSRSLGAQPVLCVETSLPRVALPEANAPGNSTRITGAHKPLHHEKMPWVYGDATVIEMIEKKRILCREIKSRQRPDGNLCKQDSMPILPSWRRRQPPPYFGRPATGPHTAVFWDTAI